MPTGNSALYTALFQNSKVNAFIQMDTAGFVTAINPAFKNYFGYTDEDVNGKHFSIFFTKEDRARRKPENEVETVLRTLQCDDKNFFVHKDGKITWVSGESILVEDENGSRSLLKMIQDIQIQKESEVSLTRANDFNESILNTIDDFVILLDSSMHVIKYNPAFARLFNNRELLPVTDFAALIKPYDKHEELHQKIVAVIQSGKSFSKQVIEILAPTGERVFDISCQPIYTRDLEHVVLVVGHDITVLKRADVEREDLMGFVAHELRNPLASIKMSNDVMGLLLQSGKANEMNDLLERNRRNIDRLNNMVAELYDAAKIGGGNFVMAVAPYDFDEMVQEAVETFRILQPAFNFTIEENAGTVVQGDRYRMMQVVSNFLGNAVKYSNGQPTVNIKIATDKNNIIFSVKDLGVGISPEQMPYIFDRFFRAEKTRDLEGIGLGLYLCRRIVHAHDGKVWAESEEGKGSVFYFSIPV